MMHTFIVVQCSKAVTENLLENTCAARVIHNVPALANGKVL